MGIDSKTFDYYLHCREYFIVISFKNVMFKIKIKER